MPARPHPGRAPLQQGATGPRPLLQQAENPALSGSGGTRTAIAARINATPQTISNALRSLQESGAIRFDHHRILIVDEDWLRAITQL